MSYVVKIIIYLLSVILFLPLEKKVHSSERSDLLKRIQTAGQIITNIEKSLKEEEREMLMARSRAAIALHLEMETLEKEDHSQSVLIVVLREQSESF